MTMSIREYVENGLCGLGKPIMEVVVSVQADYYTRVITKVNL